ncbi:dihydrofolate reductase [bacterium]|nr:dihydrofolate reductase [bacterium]
MRSRLDVKFCAFLATSLDGFIARLDGQIDWLEKANHLVPTGEDCGYGDFFASVDCLILGRKSFEKVLSFPKWPYGDKKVFVMSRKGITIPESLTNSVSCTSKSPSTLRQELAELGIKKAYVDGGQIVRAFLHAGLLNELTITKIPVLIHEGLPLFEKRGFEHEQKPVDTWFELIEVHSWPFGFVQESWKFKPN